MYSGVLGYKECIIIIIIILIIIIIILVILKILLFVRKFNRNLFIHLQSQLQLCNILHHHKLLHNIVIQCILSNG